jgi:hypothetical protein
MATLSMMMMMISQMDGVYLRLDLHCSGSLLQLYPREWLLRTSDTLLAHVFDQEQNGIDF